MNRDYRQDAQRNEQLFRNVLTDMQKRSEICPQDFNPNESIDKIFEMHSTGERYGRFTICDFVVGPHKSSLFELAEGEALVDIEDMAFLSGEGYSLIYNVREDNSVRFDRVDNMRMS